MLRQREGDHFGAEPLLQVPDFQWDDMRAYVRDCADRMGLRDYTCNYYRGRPDDLHGASDVCGAIDVNPTRRHFTIWLPLEWFRRAGGTDDERRDARNTIAHELLHVHFKRIEGMAKSTQTNLGDIAWQLWWDNMHDEIEIVIDDLSEICAEYLPMPDMPQFPPKATKAKSKASAIRPEQV